MAGADAMNTCRFRWGIREPFVPLRKWEAIFYFGSGSPSLTEWKVSIDLIPPLGFYNFPIRFVIKCLQPEGSEKIIIVERMEIKISMQARYPMNKEIQLHNYSFSRENQHSYVFEWMHFNFPIPTDVVLVINIDFTLPNRNIILPEENKLVFRHCDLTQLSRDLGQQQRNLRYCNLTLNSNQRDEFKVHSCMLHARWNNFFTEHPSIVNGTVETVNSKEILSDIRNYIYSGKGGKGIIIPRDKYALTQLFQMIDKYRLHHLYKSFVKDDSCQLRLSSQIGKKSSIELELDNPAYGPPLMCPIYEWTIHRNSPAYEFFVKISFNLKGDSPSFSYRWESRSPLRLFAQLSVEFVERRIENARNQEFQPMQLHGVIFLPFGTRNDGPFEIANPRQNPLLNRYMESSNLRPEQRTCRYAIRCILCLVSFVENIVLCSNLTSKEKLPYYEFQDDMEMLNVLSDHMSELLNQRYDHDFKVVCRSENAINGEDTHLLHKAIFSARVPNYWAVLEGVEKPEDIPDEARCILSSEAFRYVVQYIYTGKVFPIPIQLLDEIRNFADKGEFNSLKTLVDKIRTDARDS